LAICLHDRPWSRSRWAASRLPERLPFATRVIERYMHLAPGSVQEAAQKLAEAIARFGDRMETAQGSEKNP
jgi:hypothetical protein